MGDRLEQGVECSGLEPSQMRLELRVGHFDGVQVRAVGRQEQQPVPLRLEDGLCVCGLMRRQVVGDHHVARLQCRCQLGLDVDVEGGAVHRAVQYPGRAEFVDPQPGDEGLGAPVAEGRIGFEPGSSQGPAPQAGHLGGNGGLIDEHQPVRLTTHPWYPAVLPLVPGGADPFAQPFRRDQRFFYM